MEDLEAFQGEPLVSEERGAILHRLNREAINTKGKKVMLNADDFKKTEKSWAGAPIIFAKKHPAPNPNMAKRLAEVEGRLLGAAKSAEVVMEGSPRLVAALEFEKDKEFEKLYKAGKIEISPAWTDSPDGPIPDHILVYEGGLIPPGDKGAMMFQELKENPKEFFAYMFQSAKDFVKKEEKAMGELEDVKLKLEAFQNTEKQKAAELNAFQEKVKTLEAEKLEKEKALNAFQEKADQEVKDKAFNTFQAKCPPGWKAGKVKIKNEKGEEVESEMFQELRKSFEKDVQGSYEKLYEHLKKTNQFQEGDGQGDPNAGGTAPEKHESVGAWDYKTRKWKNE